MASALRRTRFQRCWNRPAAYSFSSGASGGAAASGAPASFASPGGGLRERLRERLPEGLRRLDP